MGRDKSRLRLGRRTMLDQVRRAAQASGLPMRIIRRDCVPRCGPLGGIYTALKSTAAESLLFLACDMPFVTVELVQLLLGGFTPADHAVFTQAKGRVGFPLILRRAALPLVTQQIKRCEFSLQALSKMLKAKVLRPPGAFGPQLRNINTPADWDRARLLWGAASGPGSE